MEVEAPQRKFVRLKKGGKKPKKELQAVSSSAELVQTLDKTARKAYYLGAASLVLLRILNSRRKRRAVAKKVSKAIVEEEDVIAYLARIVVKWREYLGWLQDSLQLLSLVLKSQKMELILSESQLRMLIDTTKSLHTILKSVQSALNFVVLTKVLFKKATGVAFGRYSSILWLSALAFLYTQLKDVWPQLEFESTQLWTIVSSMMTFLKGPLKNYFIELLEDIEETNPELFANLQLKLLNVHQIITAPTLLMKNGMDILKFSEGQVTPVLYKYLMPPVQNMLLKSYQTYLLSKEAITGFSTSDVVALLAQSEWSQELMMRLYKYMMWMKSSNLSGKRMSKM